MRKKQFIMKFIELTIKNHTILHGFDERNQEVILEVQVGKCFCNATS